MASRSFGSQGPSVPHLSKNQLSDLRADVEAGFTALEGRADFPKISRVVGGTAVSLAALPVAAAVVGVDLLQGQIKASLVLGTGTSALTFTANRPGTPGNDISVEIVDSEGGGLAVAVDAGVITIDLGGDTSSANQVKTAVDSDTDATALVQVVSGGAGTVVVAAEENLSGGVGVGLLAMVNGISQDIVGSATETSIPMSISALTGAANGDAAVLQIVSNGVWSDPITLGVVT
jgi:hypothetical protein